MQNLHKWASVRVDNSAQPSVSARAPRTMHSPASAFAANLLLLAAGTPLIAQTPLKDVVALLQQRREAPVKDVFADALKPDAVFRGRPLTAWMDRFRDADSDYSESARKVFLAAGARVVPFLVACEKALDWEAQHLPSIHGLIVAMGEDAVTPLVKLLGSDHAGFAWVALRGVLGRHDVLASYASKAKSESDKVKAREWFRKVRAERSRNAKRLAPCLGSSDAFTRYVGLSLLADVVGSVPRAEQGQFTRAARKIMDSDPEDRVRGAACEFLGKAGSLGVSGGLSESEADSMVRDVTLPRPVRQAAMMGLVLIKARNDRSKSRPAKPPGRRD